MTDRCIVNILFSWCGVLWLMLLLLVLLLLLLLLLFVVFELLFVWPRNDIIAFCVCVGVCYVHGTYTHTHTFAEHTDTEIRACTHTHTSPRAKIFLFNYLQLNVYWSKRSLGDGGCCCNIQVYCLSPHDCRCVDNKYAFINSFLFTSRTAHTSMGTLSRYWMATEAHTTHTFVYKPSIL